MGAVARAAASLPGRLSAPAPRPRPSCVIACGVSQPRGSDGREADDAVEPRGLPRRDRGDPRRASWRWCRARAASAGREVERRARNLAAWMLAHGASHQAKVALYTYNHPAYMEGRLGRDEGGAGARERELPLPRGGAALPARERRRRDRDRPRGFRAAAREACAAICRSCAACWWCASRARRASAERCGGADLRDGRQHRPRPRRR